MPAALPSTFLNGQPWVALKGGSSQTLPAIMDDDEESGSTSCELPDSSGPANELLTSSGDEEQWSVGNDPEDDSGDHTFLELNPVSPVGLYSSGLRSVIAALSFAQAHKDTPTLSSVPQAREESQDADFRKIRQRQERQPQQQSHQQTQQQQQSQERLIPALPSAGSSNRSLQSKRNSAPRLIALVADVARAAEAAAAAPSSGYGKDGLGDRLSSSLEVSFVPPLRQSVTPSMAGLNNVSPPPPPPSSNDQGPPPLQQGRQAQEYPSLKPGERMTNPSLGRTRSVSFAGGSPPLPMAAAAAVANALPSPSPPSVTEGSNTAGVASETIRISASSIVEYRALQTHSAPPHHHHHNHDQQQQQLQQQQQQQQQAAPQRGTDSLPSPSIVPRLRATSNSQLRILLPPSLPSAPITSPDANRQQKQQQQQKRPWWGFPIPAGVGISSSSVGRPTATSATLPASAASAGRPQPIAVSSQPLDAPAADGSDRDASGADLVERPSPRSLPSLLSLLSPQQDSVPPRPPKLQLQPQRQLQPQLQLQLQPPSFPASSRSPQVPEPSTPTLNPKHQPHHHNLDHRHISAAKSAPLLRLSESTIVSSGSGTVAGESAPLPPPPPRPPAAAGRMIKAAAAAAAPGLSPAVRGRTGRQSAPVLGRSLLQVPDLRSIITGGESNGGGTGGAAGASSGAAATPTATESVAVVGEPREPYISAVGSLARPPGGPPAVEVPPAPEIVLRPPRWLKPSAFQVTEQLRSGRLQELVDRLATVNCPTLFDLGGCEFSGTFTPAPPLAPGGADGAKSPDFFSVAIAAVAAASALGGVTSPTMAHKAQNQRAGVQLDDGNLSARSRYLRNAPGAGSQVQVLAIPPGQHITLNNATLLLTADQYIFVGPGASLTLKGVEVLGCSREAARQSAAVRRRAFSMAAAAAAASASPSVQAAAAAAAVAAITSTASTGYAKLVRRSSSPGRTTRDAGVYGVGTTARRVSVGDNVADAGGAGLGGGGGGGGPGGAAGLPTVRRRSVGTMGNAPFVVASPIPGQITTSVAAHELVDPNEYVDTHGLVEVVGGYARISNCRIWPGRCQLALCVSDGGRCSLSYSTAGACCAAGPKSCLVSEQTTYDGGAAGCVSALWGGRLGLTDCKLRYADSSTSGETSDAVPSAICDLGIEARGSGTLAVLTNCDITHGGATAALGARLYLQSTRVSDARGHGLMASDPGTILYVRDCRVNDSGRSAIVSCDGAAVRVADAMLAGSAASGAVILPPTIADGIAGDGGESVAAATAAAAAAAQLTSLLPRSTLTLLRCEISANAGHGAFVAGGGFLAVSDCVLYNNLGCGLAAEGGGSVVSAVSTRLIRNDAQGVRAACGAGLVMTRCCAMGNSRDGVAVEGAGSRAHLTRCESRENRESGLCVTGGGAVELTYSRLAANQHDGLAVGGTGSLAVAHSCVLNGNVAKGAVVCMGGSAELSECAVHCNGSKSAQVSDEESRLVLCRGCSLDRQPVAASGGALMHI
ncbi:hypothetical protein Vafri_16142 [Volvox africanus]|nr:hypothetical protein Vafri_16142 [Volvox africanus]